MACLIDLVTFCCGSTTYCRSFSWMFADILYIFGIEIFREMDRSSGFPSLAYQEWFWVTWLLHDGSVGNEGRFFTDSKFRLENFLRNAKISFDSWVDGCWLNHLTWWFWRNSASHGARHGKKKKKHPRFKMLHLKPLQPFNCWDCFCVLVALYST